MAAFYISVYYSIRFKMGGLTRVTLSWIWPVFTDCFKSGVDNSAFGRKGNFFRNFLKFGKKLFASYTVVYLLLFSFILSVQSIDFPQVPASLGQNVTLPCRAPSNINILAVIWTRTNLSSQYVLFFRDGNLDTDNTESSYEDRVTLGNDSQDGNLSLILSNVTSSDYGTYKTYIKEGKDREIVTLQLICTLYLTESVSDKPDVRVGERLPKSIVVILTVVGLIVVGLCVAVYWIYRRRPKNHKSGHHDPENGQLNPVGPDGSMCSVSADPVLTKAYTAVRTMLINGYKYNNSKNNNL